MRRFEVWISDEEIWRLPAIIQPAINSDLCLHLETEGSYSIPHYDTTHFIPRTLTFIFGSPNLSKLTVFLLALIHLLTCKGGIPRMRSMVPPPPRSPIRAPSSNIHPLSLSLRDHYRQARDWPRTEWWMRGAFVSEGFIVSLHYSSSHNLAAPRGKVAIVFFGIDDGVDHLYSCKTIYKGSQDWFHIIGYIFLNSFWLILFGNITTKMMLFPGGWKQSVVISGGHNPLSFIFPWHLLFYPNYLPVLEWFWLPAPQHLY